MRPVFGTVAGAAASCRVSGPNTMFFCLHKYANARQNTAKTAVRQAPAAGDAVAAYSLLLWRRHCHTTVPRPGRAVTPIKTRFISLPSFHPSFLYPISLPVHRSFCSHSVDWCSAGLIPVTVLSHVTHTHTPAICMLRRGRAQLGSQLKAC